VCAARHATPSRGDTPPLAAAADTPTRCIRHLPLLPLATAVHQGASAEVYLHGAHVVSWKDPSGKVRWVTRPATQAQPPRNRLALSVTVQLVATPKTATQHYPASHNMRVSVNTGHPVYQQGGRLQATQGHQVGVFSRAAVCRPLAQHQQSSPTHCLLPHTTLAGVACRCAFHSLASWARWGSTALLATPRSVWHTSRGAAQPW
jgi:hypothetical protein